PQVVIQMKDPTASADTQGQEFVYTRLLNEEATGWEGKDFRQMEVNAAILDIYALVSQVNGLSNFLFFKAPDDVHCEKEQAAVDAAQSALDNIDCSGLIGKEHGDCVKQQKAAAAELRAAQKALDQCLRGTPIVVKAGWF